MWWEQPEHNPAPARSSLRTIKPSLGASGAVLSLFAATAVYHPDASVALIFLPMFPFTIGSGLKVSSKRLSLILMSLQHTDNAWHTPCDDPSFWLSCCSPLHNLQYAA